MPNRIEGWECGICGTLHKDEELAQRCEAGHQYPGEYRSARTKYPKEIDIEFQDGRHNVAVITYRACTA